MMFLSSASLDYFTNYTLILQSDPQDWMGKWKSKSLISGFCELKWNRRIINSFDREVKSSKKF